MIFLGHPCFTFAKDTNQVFKAAKVNIHINTRSRIFTLIPVFRKPPRKCLQEKRMRSYEIRTSEKTVARALDWFPCPM